MGGSLSVSNLTVMTHQYRDAIVCEAPGVFFIASGA